MCTLKSCFALIFTVLLQCGVMAQSNQAGKTRNYVIADVSIVDVDKGLVQENNLVEIRDGIIYRIAQSGDKRDLEDAEVIDGKGLFLIPGLINAHVHYIDPSAFGPMMIANGVLFVRDMGNPTSDVIVLRNKLNRGEILGPEMITTGSVLDGYPPSIPPISIPCKTPEEGRDAVRRQVQAGVNAIKVYSGLQKDVFLAILDEAEKQRIKVVGHIPESIYIEEAAEAGLKSSEHPFGFGKIIAKLLGEPAQLSVAGMGTDVQYFLRYKDVDKEEFRKVLKRICAIGMHVCPTLVVFKHGPYLKEIFSGSYPMTEFVSPMVKGMWKSFWAGQQGNELLSKILSPMQEVVKEMHESGIQLMVGTDLITPGVIPGYSVHEEMELWQEAGIPPIEILRSATTIPAKFMGVDNRLGTVSEGKNASLVLLRSNPLDDIRNAEQIEGVIYRDSYYSRTDLNNLLLGVKKACNPGR